MSFMLTTITSSTSNTRLVDSSRKLNPMIFINHDMHNHLRQKNEDDEEIGVFGAEKYFKGVIDEKTSTISSTGSRNDHHYKRYDKGININHVRAKIQPRTPSVSSQSSWNSQIALLQSALRNPSRSKSRRKSNGKNFLSNFGCKCACLDKNAIDVKEDVEISFNKNTNSIKAGLELVDTVQNTKLPFDSRIKKQINNKKQDILGTGLIRESKSGELFGSPIIEKGNRCPSPDNRLSMMSWDVSGNPRADEIEITGNDSQSDESSDLFEIETITNKPNSCVRRKQSDDISGCASPTTCYAPSELSIEWSVVTANAVDFSVISDCEDQRSTVYMSSPKKMNPTTSDSKNKMNREIQRKRSSTSFSCKSHEAVKVTGNVYRTNERSNYDQFMHRKSDSFVPLTRFQAENKQPALKSTSNPQPIYNSII